MRWFGLVKRRNNNNIVKEIGEIIEGRNQGTDRPKKNYVMVLRKIWGHVV